jgi:hypothetical protein
MDPFDEVTSRSQLPGLLRRIRIRISILEVMLLVAVVAVSFRWPGLSVPVSLLFLYTLARRREILQRPTRVALGQVALALYLPTAVGLFLVPREEWDYYLENFSLMPTYIAAGLLVDSLPWWFRFHSRLLPIAIVVLSTTLLFAVIVWLGKVARHGWAWRIACLSHVAATIGLMLPWFPSSPIPLGVIVMSTIPPLAVIAGLGLTARRGPAWRIAGLGLATAMSAGSTFFTWVLLHAGA